MHVDCSTCRPANHGPQFTLTEGYKWSLNVVFAQLALQIGSNRMAEYARRFGFGTRYDLGVPVEASSIVSDVRMDASKNLLAATATGKAKCRPRPANGAGGGHGRSRWQATRALHGAVGQRPPDGRTSSGSFSRTRWAGCSRPQLTTPSKG